MVEDAPAPERRRLLIGTLTVLLLVVIAAAAGVVIWYTVLDDLSVPEIITIGDDGDDATEAPAETPVTTEEEQAGQRRSSDDPQETPASQQGVLIVPQEIKLIDIIPSPQIVTLNGPGQSQRLTVQGFYSDGSTGDLVLEPGEEFFFASSDTSVAVVAPNGVVSSLNAGGADVLVAYRNFEAEVPVLVWGEVRQIPPIDPERLLQVDDDGVAIVLNRVMVKLEPGYGSDDATQIAASVGGEVIFEYRTFPGYVVETEASTEEELEAGLAVIQGDRRVAHAYPDLLVPAGQVPERPHVEAAICTQSAFFNTGMKKALDLMSKVALKPVVVGVVDGEWYPHHKRDVVNNEFNVASYSYIDAESGEEKNRGFGGHNSTFVFDLIEGTISSPHGIAVSGVILAKECGVVGSVQNLLYTHVFFGIGAEVGWWVFKKDDIPVTHNKIIDNLASENNDNYTNDENYTFVSMLGTILALENIDPYEGQFDVVNMSFAFDCDECKESDPWVKDLIDGIKNLSHITFVTSAGNNGDDIDKNFEAPNSLTHLIDNLITVASVKDNGLGQYSPSDFSNYGYGVTLAAPGEEIYTFAVKSGYGLRTGTSFAAPLVSGTVALLKALNPSLTPLKIKKILTGTGTPMSKGQPANKDWPILNARAAVQDVLNTRACLPPSGAPEAYSQTRGRMIEVETFQKPSAVSSAMLMFKINNPSSSSGPFFIKEEILSHPDQFGWFNENPMREIGIRPGGTAHLLITPNPNRYTHPESGKREFDLDWETFNFGCELEIRLSVFADEAESVLLDYVTLRERMEPFQREPWEQTSEPGFVVTPVPFPVTNAEVSAKARELKRRLEPITDLITSRTEGFSGGCTGVISEWEEMYIGIQELYLYPTSQLKMGVLERIEMMLNEFIPKWERAGCL